MPIAEEATLVAEPKEQQKAVPGERERITSRCGAAIRASLHFVKDLIISTTLQ
jgi:hypothetical protein